MKKNRILLVNAKRANEPIKWQHLNWVHGHCWSRQQGQRREHTLSRVEWNGLVAGVKGQTVWRPVEREL